MPGALLYLDVRELVEQVEGHGVIGHENAGQTLLLRQIVGLSSSIKHWLYIDDMSVPSGWLGQLDPQNFVNADSDSGQ